MTTSKHFKHLFRARMDATGESYTRAAAQVREALTDIGLDGPITCEVHGKHGQSVAFSPDGTRLLSAGQDARIAILDARTGTTTGDARRSEHVPPVA